MKNYSTKVKRKTWFCKKNTAFCSPFCEVTAVTLHFDLQIGLLFHAYFYNYSRYINKNDHQIHIQIDGHFNIHFGFL